MTFAFYSPSPRPRDEILRQAAVDALDVLAMTGLPELQRLVEAAAALFATPRAALSIIDRDRQYLIASVGVEVRETSRAVSFCTHAILTPDAPLVVEDARSDIRFAGNPVVLGGPRIRFYAGAPLIGRARLPLGALCVLDQVAHAKPNEATLYALAALSAEASAIIYARADSRNVA